MKFTGPLPMQAGGLASILNISDALAAIRESIAAGNAGEHVAYLPDFIANSERGIIK